MSVQEKIQFPSLSRYIEIKQRAYDQFPLFRRLALISEKEQLEYIGSMELPVRDPIERQIFVNTLMMPNDLYFSQETSGRLITDQKRLALLHRVTLADVRFKKVELDHYRLKEMIDDEIPLEKAIFSRKDASQDYPECYYQRNAHMEIEEPVQGTVANFIASFPDALSLKKEEQPQVHTVQMPRFSRQDGIQLYFPGKRIARSTDTDLHSGKSGKVH